VKFEFIECSEPVKIEGVRLAAANAGIRGRLRDDVVLVELVPGAQTAAVFTQNKFCAAPVIVARENIASKQPKFLVFNSGNANAGTGRQGIANAQKVIHGLADIQGCSSGEIMPFSTGVIGERLNYKKIIAVFPELIQSLAADRWEGAAQAIMTTDLVAKYFSLEIKVGDESYRVSGIAKGSGMIHPNMATMLAFIATDANIHQKHVQLILAECVNRSFNRISVDGDTSTNDACVLTATGKAKSKSQLTPSHPHWSTVVEGISKVFESLAKSIVKDGEGATKFVEIIVESKSEEDSLAIATTVAQSPLVKTALFASDPNWGRILAAIGRAPVATMNIHKVSFWLNDYQIVKNGEPVETYEESQAAAIMEQEEIVVRISLDRGEAKVRLWTCDLSYDYVRINAEYRT
jgi:glutamate N-acetyltransferase/amino-acid N-acetyltransferase